MITVQLSICTWSSEIAYVIGMYLYINYKKKPTWNYLTRIMWLTDDVLEIVFSLTIYTKFFVCSKAAKNVNIFRKLLSLKHIHCLLLEKYTFILFLSSLLINTFVYVPCLSRMTVNKFQYTYTNNLDFPNYYTTSLTCNSMFSFRFYHVYKFKLNCLSN